MLALGMTGLFNPGGSDERHLASHSASFCFFGCEWRWSVLRIYWPESLSSSCATSCPLSENGKVSEWSAVVLVVVQSGDRNHGSFDQGI